MAQVDFSNAVLEPYTDVKPLTAQYDLGIEINNISNANSGIIASNLTTTVLENTLSKRSVLFTGTFTDSGTECYLYYYFSIAVHNIYWKISNISFSSGDTFSFVIDIEVSGNT